MKIRIIKNSDTNFTLQASGWFSFGLWMPYYAGVEYPFQEPGERYEFVSRIFPSFKDADDFVANRIATGKRAWIKHDKHQDVVRTYTF